jgi:hypothetical protein
LIHAIARGIAASPVHPDPRRYSTLQRRAAIHRWARRFLGILDKVAKNFPAETGQ